MPTTDEERLKLIPYLMRDYELKDADGAKVGTILLYFDEKINKSLGP